MCPHEFESALVLSQSSSLDPTAAAFVPNRAQHGPGQQETSVTQEQPRPFNIAKYGDVPDELTGRAYRSFNDAERYLIKQFRCALLLCEGCGHPKHDTTDCRLLAKKHQYCQDRNLCLECASPDHARADCPYRAALVKSLGRLAKPGEVRPRMEGMAYRFMREWEKKDVRTYRRVHRRCTFCGGEHNMYACEKREKTFHQALERKKQAIAAGGLTIVPGDIGLLQKLPLELREPIWDEITKRHYDITIRRGMLDKYILQYGLPFGEMLKSYLSTNVFVINSILDVEHFDRWLTFFKGHGFVRTIRTPLVISNNWYYNGLDEDVLNTLLAKCTSFSKLLLTVRVDELKRADAGSSPSPEQDTISARADVDLSEL